MTMLEKMTVARPQTVCKCCSGISRLCGVVDFSRGGDNHTAGRKIEPYAGVPIYYYCCGECGFTFTQAMDAWTNHDFATHIYNDDYARLDPDYLGQRAITNAELVGRNFPELAQSNVLDFGSGLGLLEKELKVRGFTHIDSWDPYAQASNMASRPAQAYQVVMSFEVFEHHPQPHELMAELKAFLADEGAFLISTLLITDEIIGSGIEKWWYCSPRTGHISFFTPKSLAALAKRHEFRAGSFNGGLHFFYRGSAPSWIVKFNRTEY